MAQPALMASLFDDPPAARSSDSDTDQSQTKPVLLPRPMLQTSAPFSPFQGKEAMAWEKARTAFGHAVRAAGRDAEITTYTGHGIPPGKLDHRKLARLANTLLGRVASGRPDPTTEDWQQARDVIAESVGLPIEPED